MAYQFQYPQNYELALLQADLMATGTMTEDPIFAHVPIVAKPVSRIEWVMRENLHGLQALRGLNGAAPRVSNLGASQYAMKPGVFGENMVIDEQELTDRAPYNYPGAVINIDDLVTERMKILIGREISRARSMIWTMMQTGVVSVTAPGTGAMQAMWQYDIRKASVSGQTITQYAPPVAPAIVGAQTLAYAFGPTWDNLATSTPLSDMEAVQQAWEIGTSCQFGVTANMFMNRKTFRYILNSTSLGMRIVATNPAIAPSEQSVTNLFTAMGLPKPNIINDGYLDDSSVWHYYVPDGAIIWVGTRPNAEPVAQYVQTRNAMDPTFAPGPYIHVVDTLDLGLAPRNIIVERGVNAGIALWYPNAIGSMQVTA